MFIYVTWVAVTRYVSILQVEMLSWGYLFQRAYTLQINLFPLVSRIPNARVDNQHIENESTASNLTEEIKLTGRIMLNIWRLMRHEVYFTVLNCISHWNLVTCSQRRHLPFSVRNISRLHVWNVKDDQYINTGWGNLSTRITSSFCVIFGLLYAEIVFHSWLGPAVCALLLKNKLKNVCVVYLQ